MGRLKTISHMNHKHIVDTLYGSTDYVVITRKNGYTPMYGTGIIVSDKQQKKYCIIIDRANDGIWNEKREEESLKRVRDMYDEDDEDEERAYEEYCEDREIRLNPVNMLMKEKVYYKLITPLVSIKTVDIYIIQKDKTNGHTVAIQIDTDKLINDKTNVLFEDKYEDSELWYIRLDKCLGKKKDFGKMYLDKTGLSDLSNSAPDSHKQEVKLDDLLHQEIKASCKCDICMDTHMYLCELKECHHKACRECLTKNVILPLGAGYPKRFCPFCRKEYEISDIKETISWDDTSSWDK